MTPEVLKKLEEKLKKRKEKEKLERFKKKKKTRRKNTESAKRRRRLAKEKKKSEERIRKALEKSLSPKYRKKSKSGRRVWKKAWIDGVDTQMRRRIEPVVTTMEKERFKEVLPVLKVVEKRKHCLLCQRWAVRGSDYCKMHGGRSRILKQNLVPDEKFAPQVKPTNWRLKKAYNPDKHPYWFLDLMKEGKSVAEAAKIMRVSAVTLEKWANTYELFAEAWELGHSLQEAWWVEKGKKGLDSRMFNTKLYKYLTGNLIGWAEKVESKNLNFNACGVLVAPAQRDPSEWEQEAQEVLEEREALVIDHDSQN